MEFLIHIDTISMDLSFLHFKGSGGHNFNIFLYLKITCILSKNSADPDEMPHANEVLFKSLVKLAVEKVW